MRHSELPPVLDVIVVDGNAIEIRYHGTWADLCRNYVKSLQHNSIKLQGGNHDIGNHPRGPVAASVGDSDRVGSVQGGGEVGR